MSRKERESSKNLPLVWISKRLKKDLKEKSRKSFFLYSANNPISSYPNRTAVVFLFKFRRRKIYI
jgi:hypothetical protein